MIGVSPTGIKLWESQVALRLSQWIWAGDRLVVSGVGGDIWVVDQAGPIPLESDVGGRLAAVGGNAALSYDEEGVHLLDLEARTVRRLYHLPGGFPGYGDLALIQPHGLDLQAIADPDDATLPGSLILVTHKDATGDSLTALDPGGRVHWRRSFGRSLRESRALYVLSGRAYLVSHVRGPSSSEVAVYEVATESAELLRVFSGGSRGPTTTGTWLAPAGNGHLLIHIEDTGMVCLDVEAAGRAVRDE
jgi:hypothetical protein